MTKQADSFDDLRIASPCPVAWEKMKGDEQVRFCSQCSLNVYNLSGMTRRQAEALVKQAEGRLCVRFYKRADGTILTRDCPVGLRALRRRTARIVGAAATALMSFCLTAMGQQQQQKKPAACEPDSVKTPIKRTKIEAAAQDDFATFSGKLTDPMGAVVPGVEVVLINERTKKDFRTTTDEEGEFHFPLLEKGFYTLKIEAATGFSKYERQQISVRGGEAMRLDVALESSGTTVWVGIMSTPYMIDTTKPGGTFTITSDMIQKLPYED